MTQPQPIPPQTIQFSTGDRIAAVAFVGGLGGMIAGAALDHAYPDLGIWMWRMIFWPSTAAMLLALTFLIFDLAIRPPLVQRGIKPKTSAVLASLSLIGGFVALFGYAVIHSPANNDDILPEIIPTQPVVPPNPIVAPPGQRPLVSSAAKFIFACYAPKQTAAEAAKQKAFLQNSLKQFGDQIGFDISMSDAVGGFHVTVEARTDEAKNRFLSLGRTSYCHNRVHRRLFVAHISSPSALHVTLSQSTSTAPSNCPPPTRA